LEILPSKCSSPRDYDYTGGFGDVYTNDTGLDGATFFTGSRNFKVREIEVFEITD
jgi:hypothetical protein